ncbi:hypothetical protein PRIPAC_91756, partial [Pristionchus pacificus]|uniref:Uncharacterized protein n=2 Tax=Pristionchus pacificus TaxID=54126 RepID=A0A2A6CIF6_PRIPA
MWPLRGPLRESRRLHFAQLGGSLLVLPWRGPSMASHDRLSHRVGHAAAVLPFPSGSSPRRALWPSQGRTPPRAL